ALSRGASSAVFVEWSPPAVTILRENVYKVGLGGRVVATDVFDFLEGEKDHYDLAFVDPPYAMPLASVVEVLERLVDQLKPNAVVVVHRRTGETPPSLSGLALAWEREYGDAQVWRFVKLHEEAMT
ncbi:MAG: 16S rRNA (guanine(966)-N(2))-methyltransferase RsmD, partial [Acidimicrobiia bacterium]|nr:16S rRNA (guanine(966)-N(2))-methyltransferase RsmD [Acidimicrobiia bacterium]